MYKLMAYKDDDNIGFCVIAGSWSEIMASLCSKALQVDLLAAGYKHWRTMIDWKEVITF